MFRQMKTMAESLGNTTHLSPLLRKTRRLGLEDPAALLRLAVRRGCRHYTPGDYDEASVFDPGNDRLSDAELAIALISGAQTYDPQLVRCAAQLLGGPDLRPRTVARLATMERCVATLRHIAEAGLRYDQEYQDFWREILTALPISRAAVPRGVLPHPTRFVSQSGAVRGQRAGGRIVWLRPSSGGMTKRV